MDKLTAATPCAGLLPVSHGDLKATELDTGPITSLAPFKGRKQALSDALQASVGVGFPAPNTCLSSGQVRGVWTGMEQAFLLGTEAQADWSPHAAMSDQSDAWAAVLLAGRGAQDVLARLIPSDLRTAVFPQGAALRSLCGHMTVSVIHLPEGYGILAFRSMAATLVHELDVAMRSVAARDQLR